MTKFPGTLRNLRTRLGLTASFVIGIGVSTSNAAPAPIPTLEEGLPYCHYHYGRCTANADRELLSNLALGGDYSPRQKYCVLQELQEGFDKVYEMMSLHMEIFELAQMNGQLDNPIVMHFVNEFGDIVSTAVSQTPATFHSIRRSLDELAYSIAQCSETFSADSTAPDGYLDLGYANLNRSLLAYSATQNSCYQIQRACIELVETKKKIKELEEQIERERREQAERDRPFFATNPQIIIGPPRL